MACDVQIFVAGRDLTLDIGDEWASEDQTNGGSYRFTFKMTWASGNWMPPKYSPVLVRDSASGFDFWGGRIAPYDLKGWDGCQGVREYTALGGTSYLTDDIFDEANAYGPRGGQQTVGTSNGVTIITPRAAVLDALRKAPGITGNQGHIADPGGTIAFPTQNTLLRYPKDIIENMAALYAYLGTPIMWQVRPENGNPTLFWGPLNTAVRYEVTIGPGRGTTVDIHRDPDQEHNKVVATYSRDQAYVAPDPRIGQVLTPIAGLSGPRAIPVNLSSTQYAYGQYAQQIAQGLLQRGSTLNYGWSYTLHVPMGEQVYEHDIGAGNPSGYIYPWLVQSGSMIRINGLGNFPDGQPPDVHYIRHVGYNQKEGMLEITCGEPLEIAALVQVGNIANNIRVGERALNNPSAHGAGPDEVAKIGAKVPITSAPPASGPGPGNQFGGVPGYGYPAFATPVAPPTPPVSKPDDGTLTSAQPQNPNVSVITPQSIAQSPAGFVFNISGAQLATLNAGASMVMPVPCIIGVYSVFISKAMHVKIDVSFGTKSNVRCTIDTTSFTADKISDWRKPNDNKPISITTPTAVFARVTLADATITDVEDHLSITFAGPKAWPGCPDIETDSTGDLVYKNNANVGLGQIATTVPPPTP